MTRAASFAIKSEKLINRGHEAAADKLNWMIEHASRVQKLSDKIVSNTERNTALARIWRCYAEVQAQVEAGVPEYRDAHLRMNWDDYLQSFDDG